METWPHEVLVPRRGGRPNYRPRNLAGPASLSGFAQVVSADAGIWMVGYEEIVIRTWGHIQTWDTLALRLEGRLNPLLVPVCQGSRQPVPSGFDPGSVDVPHDDDTPFDDLSLYTQPSIIIAVVAADAALRATQVQIEMRLGGTIEPAHFFSIGTRLYQVRRVMGSAASAEGITYTLDIRPPLREAIFADDDAEFGRPVCKMRLLTDDAMNLTLELNRWASPSVAFIEDPT